MWKKAGVYVVVPTSMCFRGLDSEAVINNIAYIVWYDGECDAVFRIKCVQRSVWNAVKKAKFHRILSLLDRAVYVKLLEPS